MHIAYVHGTKPRPYCAILAHTNEEGIIDCWVSSFNYTVNGILGLVNHGGELLLKNIIFGYHWTSLCIKDIKKINKAKKKFKGHRSIL